MTQSQTNLLARAFTYLGHEAGWWRLACVAFYQEWQQRTKKEKQEASQVLDEMLAEVQRIGSPLYQRLYATACPVESRFDKITLLRHQLDVWLDQQHFLQLGTKAYTFDAQLHPDSPFWREVARAMQARYPDGAIQEAEDHQLRMYFDRHNLWYLRQHFLKAGETDWQAFQRYQRHFSWQKPAGSLGRPARNESARLHNKYPRTTSLAAFYQKGLNIKKVSHHFHSEFIFDAQGALVSQWNVLEQTPQGTIQSDGAYYRQKYPETYLKFALQVVNMESFNYAESNDYRQDGSGRHNQLDATPVRHHEHALRKELFPLFVTPEDDYWTVKRALANPRRRQR